MQGTAKVSLTGVFVLVSLLHTVRCQLPVPLLSLMPTDVSSPPASASPIGRAWGGARRAASRGALWRLQLGTKPDPRKACEATRAVGPGSRGGSEGALCCCVCTSQRRHQRMSCHRVCANAAGSLHLSRSGSLKCLPRARRLWCGCPRCHPQSQLPHGVACEPLSLLHWEMPGHFRAPQQSWCCWGCLFFVLGQPVISI